MCAFPAVRAPVFSVCSPATRAARRVRGAALPLWVIAIAPGAWADNARVDWTRGCPPNGYGVAQPALDKDLDGDGTNDAWDCPITIDKPGGGTFTTTDAMGNMVHLPAVPHSAANLGGPNGHYSPRFVPAGAANMTGTEIGQCVWPCGRNTWKLCFDDANNDCVPDKFTKSTWISEDFKDMNGDGEWDTSTGKSTTFTTDLTKKKIVPARTERRPGRTVQFDILDATIVNSGATLADVDLNGGPIGYPGGEDGMYQDMADRTATNTLMGSDLPVSPGEIITALGELINDDVIPHTYQLATFGVNASGLLTTFSSPITLGPGGVYTYSITGTVIGTGEAALLGYAYSDTGDVLENDIDAHVFIPEPASLLLLIASGFMIALRR